MKGPPLMDKGLIIALEGSDGCGKSTTADLLLTNLKEAGVPSVVYHSPGATSVGIKISEMIYDEKVGGPTRSLLYTADFCHLMHDTIKPLVDIGVSVILDRYSYISELAYSGVSGPVTDIKSRLDDVTKLHFGIAKCIPWDHLFILDTDYETARDRILTNGRTNNNFVDTKFTNNHEWGAGICNTYKKMPDILHTASSLGYSDKPFGGVHKVFGDDKSLMSLSPAEVAARIFSKLSESF